MNDEVVRVLAGLLGAGTLGAALLRIVDRLFKRADQGDAVVVVARAELIHRLEVLEARCATLEQSERHWWHRSVELEAEVRALRARFGAVVRWLKLHPLVADEIPDWVYEEVPVPPPTSDLPDC